MSDSAAISCTKLKKIYRVGFWGKKVTGLAELNLRVEPGEVFGFIGPNGAGKTTTIKTLVGLQNPTAGKAQIFGHPTGTPAANALLGFLPERPYFYAHLTGRELVRFYGNLHGRNGPELEEEIEMLLERVGLRKFESVKLSAYSKGMLQRAGLAQAMLNQPKLIILDEPMSGLDPMGRMLVRDLILEEKERGTTIFFSSHILADVEQICDRVGLVVNGEMKACGPVQDLLSQSVQWVDCVVSHIDANALEGTQMGTDGDRIRVRVSAEQLDEFLDSVRSQQGRILEVQPKRQGLEELLTDQMGLDIRQDDPKKMGVL